MLALVGIPDRNLYVLVGRSGPIIVDPVRERFICRGLGLATRKEWGFPFSLELHEEDPCVTSSNGLTFTSDAKPPVAATRISASQKSTPKEITRNRPSKKQYWY